VDVALDLAPAYSAAYAAAAPRRFLESPSQVNKDATGRIGRFSFGLSSTLAAGVGLTRKFSQKLDVRKSKFFSNSKSPNQPQHIPGPTIFHLCDTPAMGELEFVTAPLASPGMSNPFDSAFARPNSPSTPTLSSHLRPRLDRFDSAASTLVPNRASQAATSYTQSDRLGRKQSTRTTVLDEQEEEEEEDEQNENGDVDVRNSRLSSSTIEKGLLWRTLPGGSLRDGEPLGVSHGDQLMAISASSSESSLVPFRASGQHQLSPARNGAGNGEGVDSPTDPREESAFRTIKGSRTDQIIFSGDAASRLSNLDASSSSIGLGISMESSLETDEVVENAYRSVQKLVREGLGTPRKRARAASDVRSLKSLDSSSIDPDYSIGALTMRSRSATMDSTRSVCLQRSGRNRSGTLDSTRSNLGARRRANSDGRGRTLHQSMVDEDINKFYPGVKAIHQNRSRKSSGASLVVPPRFSVSVKTSENSNKHFSTASSASFWSRDSRPSSYIPNFTSGESRQSVPPPVPEKDSLSPQLNEASTALKDFFDSPSQGKRRRVEAIQSESDQSGSSSNSRGLPSRFSPFETPSPEARKILTPSTFSTLASTLPAFPSSAAISPKINYPSPRSNVKGPVHPIELQMRLEDAREEILNNGNGTGGDVFYSSAASYTPILSTSSKLASVAVSKGKLTGNVITGISSNKDGRPIIATSVISRHQTAISKPEEYDTSHCGNASADTWSSFAGDDTVISMEVDGKAQGSNTVRISSAFDPRRSGSFATKATARYRSSHASQTPIVTVTEAFEPVVTSTPQFSLASSSLNGSTSSSSSPEPASTPATTLASSPGSPPSIGRSRTISGDSRRSRENSFGGDVSKSPRTRPRGATIPAPRAALRGARAAAAAAASAIQGLSMDTTVDSLRAESPRVAFAPLFGDDRPSSRPSSPRVAFAETASISSSSSSLRESDASSEIHEIPLSSSPLKTPISSTPEKAFRSRTPKSMSSSKKRAPSNLRIDTSGRKQISSRSSSYDTSEELETPILGGSSDMSSDSLEIASPTSSISISSSLPLSVRTEQASEVEDLIRENRIIKKQSIQSNSLLSADAANGSLSSLKRARATTSRSSDYASPTMLVFRFYELDDEDH